MEDTRRELRREDIRDRRVRLLASPDGRSMVTIEVREPHGIWDDISFVAVRGCAQARPCASMRDG